MNPRLKSLIRRAIGDPPRLLEEMPNAPGLFQTYRDLIATGHERVEGGWKYQGKFYPDYLTVGGAVFGILPKAQEFCQGRGLDVGGGLWPFPGSTPIDTASGPGTANKLSDIPDGSQDYVFSSHTLEHIADWRDALAVWVAKVKPGGILFLYLPHPECGLWRKENPFMAQHHAWIPTPEVVRDAVEKSGFTILSSNDKPDLMYSFHVCGKKAG
jgi:hypothetical protein